MNGDYLVIDKKVLPEVYEKVIATKKILQEGKVKEITEATKLAGISRSVYYKYKDYVFEFSQMSNGRKATFNMIIGHEKGVLSNILNLISEYQGNILTIDQGIPINNLANLSLTIDISSMKIELSELFDPYTQLVIFQFRLPRLLCAILVGGGMALAGHILQTVLQNDLADPGVIGINSGISFFVLLYILVSGTDIFLDYVWMPLAGMIGAVITIGLLMFLIYEKERGIDPIRMTICGVALNLGFQGLILFFSAKLNRQKFSYVQLWNAGILTGTDWLKIALLITILVIIGVILWKYQDVLNIFSLGKESVITLGVDLKKQTIILISLAGFLAAFTIAFGGSIPFVGLIAPHIARRLVGSNHRYSLWVSMLMGSLMVIIGDSLSRSLMSTGEIPTGIILSLIGVPYFIYLLKKERA